ncbi:MAG TPA: hypothetical protein VEC99_18030, partial [Clostridia bacterium]|nr:hypothetical protein [Clostridia bacterium]
AANADADGDGMATWQEYVAGTSPVNGLSCLQLIPMPIKDSSLRLAWLSVANRRYSLWTAHSLSDGFALLTNNIAATPPTNVFALPAGERNRFYRIQVVIDQ